MTDGLRLENVSHAYGDRAVVHDVSLSVAPGKFLCLLGPSGCGKSTLLRLAAGLERLQKGSVSIGGTKVAGPGFDTPPEKRGVGLVFQDYALFPHLSVVDNVEFGLSALPAAGRRARAMTVLEQVGMAAYADAYPHMLSGGQQQRVALARALAPEPRVLLLDEPFSGLDARMRLHLREQTLRVLKGNGVAAVLVTHDPEEAMHMGDQIALMRDGRIVQSGSPADLYYQPAEPFVAGFFGDINRLSATAKSGAVETPFGALPAPGLSDGTTAQILIRPEALVLCSDQRAGAACVPARVAAARFLGRSGLVEAIVQHQGQDVSLMSRVPGHSLPAEGCLTWLSVDLRQAYVFPDDGSALDAA